ncbi:hypothetical protein BKA80DRAFT_138772 [Phyllosticta citrichinensis]
MFSSASLWQNFAVARSPGGESASLASFAVRVSILFGFGCCLAVLLVRTGSRPECRSQPVKLPPSVSIPGSEVLVCRKKETGANKLQNVFKDQKKRDEVQSRTQPPVLAPSHSLIPPRQNGPTITALFPFPSPTAEKQNSKRSWSIPGSNW